jgi:outer membrane protein
MKRLLLLFLAIGATATAAFASGGKTAFVDTQTVFDQTKLGKKYQGVLREYYDSRKKILDLDADEIQKLRDDYAKQQGVLKPEARKEKEEAIGRKINEFEKKRNEFNSELGKKNEELSQEFNEEMKGVLKEVAKREKVSLILNRSISIASKSDIPAVLYGDDDLDLTKKVIEEMDKKQDAARK